MKTDEIGIVASDINVNEKKRKKTFATTKANHDLNSSILTSYESCSIGMLEYHQTMNKNNEDSISDKFNFRFPITEFYLMKKTHNETNKTHQINANVWMRRRIFFRWYNISMYIIYKIVFLPYGVRSSWY